MTRHDALRGRFAGGSFVQRKLQHPRISSNETMAKEKREKTKEEVKRKELGAPIPPYRKRHSLVVGVARTEDEGKRPSRPRLLSIG